MLYVKKVHSKFQLLHHSKKGFVSNIYDLYHSNSSITGRRFCFNYLKVVYHLRVETKDTLFKLLKRYQDNHNPTILRKKLMSSTKQSQDEKKS